MTVSTRESTLIMMTLAVALLGGTALVARPKIDDWKKIRQEQASVRRNTEAFKQLVTKREEWANEYATLSRKLSRFPVDEEMEVHWRSVLHRQATGHQIKIVRLDPAGEEVRHGEVRELSLECRDWEGQLDGLVKLLFALETGDDMLDIRQLRIRPKGNSGVLGGRFSLYCAYMRDSETETPAETPVETKKKEG